MYNKRRIALNAHKITRNYELSQSNSWKIAWRWEKKLVSKERESINKNAIIINRIRLGKQRNKFIHFLSIIYAMDVQVKRVNTYLEMYYHGNFEGYVYSFGNTFYIQKPGSTVKLKLIDYVRELHERVCGSTRTKVFRDAVNYEEIYS